MSTNTTAAKKQKTFDNNNIGLYRYSPGALAASFQSLLKNDADEYVNAPLPDIMRESATMTDDGNKNETTTKVIIAATQLTGANLTDSSVLGYCQRAEQAILTAVKDHGAHLVLLPELWSGPYFCQNQEACLQSLATEVSPVSSNNNCNILLKRMQQLAKQYQVVLPVSIYEKSANVLYNSVVMLDSDGSNLGTYRKTHIPDGPGYQEKFYFTPGDSTGMGVFDTAIGRIGVAICWDQWFPETARILALQGCELLLYPTAIGTEPHDSTINSSAHWQRVMQGHSAANMVPVVASNRFGTEVLLSGNNDDNDKKTEKQRITFYGKSFITDNTGAILVEAADNTDELPVEVISASFNFQQNQQERLAWGLFRDRRPDLYQPILTKDGKVPKSSN
mmetsp:Transcript_7484/g.9746  ORF Transcript_7484/g.9746 Transcript_7484/m.9746 type:complete len:392 (+) Transcript_7484:96-1271(+)